MHIKGTKINSKVRGLNEILQYITKHKANTRQKWSPKDMNEAVNDVIKEVSGYLKVSQVHNVPQSTLER